LVLTYILLQRRRQKYAVRYASLSLVKQALGRGPGLRRHIPPALFLIALTILIVALARPQMSVTLPGQQGTVILTIDVSGSMAADDLKPTRMEAAKAAARAFIQRQPPNVQVGIVSFSDNAFVVQAPTNDQDALNAAINRLSPQLGTAMGRGILVSLNSIAQAGQGDAGNFRFQTTPTPTPTPMPKGLYAPAVIVMLTDGANTEAPDPLEVAQTAVDRGVRIYTVGIGTAEGSVLHLRGQYIRVQLDEPTLQQLAQQTNGQYYSASTTQDLVKVYQNINTQFTLKTEKTEITAIFTGVGILFALAAATLSLLWFGRLP